MIEKIKIDIKATDLFLMMKWKTEYIYLYVWKQLQKPRFDKFTTTHFMGVTHNFKLIFIENKTCLHLFMNKRLFNDIDVHFLDINFKYLKFQNAFF